LPEPITATLTLLLMYNSNSAGIAKGSRDTAQALNICLEHVARLGRHHRPQRTGHQYITGAQRAVVADHGVGQPDGGIQWVVQTSRPDPGGYRLTAPHQTHAATGQVQRVQWHRSTA